MNVPAAQGIFTYRIAAELGVPETGRRVLVPLGRRTETGIVVGPAEPQDEVRDAIRLLDEAPLLTPEIVGLARWAAAHYLAPLGPADGPVKNAVFGANNARLYNFTPQQRSTLENDRFAQIKETYQKDGTDRSNRTYGYVRKRIP